VCAAVLVAFAFFGQIARANGKYQSTKDGKTLVWNGNPKPGDLATWSGRRDRNDYASGFGLLIWYEREPDSGEPQVYARFWGRMVNGKLEGPVNLHAKRKTRHAIFIAGTRVTGWARGTAPLTAAARWRALVAKQKSPPIEFATAADLRRAEPESPAAGPGDPMSDIGRQMSGPVESIHDLYSERWPKIDIDDSLRLLAFPPRRLRR